MSEKIKQVRVPGSIKRDVEARVKQVAALCLSGCEHCLEVIATPPEKILLNAKPEHMLIRTRCNLAKQPVRPPLETCNIIKRQKAA